MFTSVPDLASAAAEHRRDLLDDAANFRLVREAKRARRRRRARAAAPVTDQGPEPRLTRSA